MIDVYAVADRLGVMVEFADLGQRHGEYRDGVVTIHEGRPDTVQRIILAHELGHHWFSHRRTTDRWTRAHQEREADEFAARLLVSRLDYQWAERLYGPSVGAVAAELEVPARFVERLRDVTNRGDWGPVCGFAEPHPIDALKRLA